MYARAVSLLCIVLLGSASLACGDARAGASDVSVVIDSAGGYPVVRQAGAPGAWDASLALSVGSEAGATWFGSIRSVLLDARGSLYVVDDQRVLVSRFDSLGAEQPPIGARGRGPGEYISPYSVASLGDSLALLNPRDGKLMLYGPDGRWVRDWRALNYTGPQSVVRLYRAGPDEFWSRSRDWLRYRAGDVVDTIPIHRPALPPAGVFSCAITGGITFYGVPYGPAGFTVPTMRGEQAVAINDAYRITYIGASGDTLRVVERVAAPVPISDAEWEERMVEFRAWRARLVDAQCPRESFDRPAAKPLVNWLVADDEGNLWVESATAEGHAWEVFDADGMLIASVRGLPSANGIDPSIRAGRIALVVPDSNDIPRVQVYRIRKP